MPLTPGTGADIMIERNPTTGRWDFKWDSTGNPEFTDNGAHMVLSLLLEFRGLWWADETGRRGGTLYLIKQDTSGTLTQILAAVDQSLQPAVADGRLASFTRTARRISPGRYELNLTWIMPNGARGSIPLAVTY
jgi:phage gp46-like protein